MKVSELRAVLEQFSRHAKAGVLTENRPVNQTRASADVSELGRLAEALASKLAQAEKERFIKNEDTISFAPNRCPCCGK